MKRIDASDWQEFVIGDLFDIRPTVSYKENNAVLFDGGSNPVVVNSSLNNGIGGYTSRPTTEKGGRITFSDTTTASAVFYQPKDFVGYSHIQGLNPIGDFADKWTEKSLLFFLTIFKTSAASHCFDYTHKFTRRIASSMVVKLPAISGEPDWAIWRAIWRSF